MTFAKPEVEEIDTRFLRTDGGTQTRASLNIFTVDSYAEAMKEGVNFPPIITYYDGTDYWLADGFHRLAAAERAGHSAIDCEIRQGTRRDAILYSVGANANHGLQRTREDVRRAIDLLLRDQEWCEWSDSAIAGKVGCNHKTVGSRRAELVAAGEIEDSGIRRAADGRMMNTAKIGDGPSEVPTASMLTPAPIIHASMPDDDELAVVEPESAPIANPAPASKAIPSLVTLSPAPAPRVDNHPVPSSAPALLAAAVKAAPALTPAPALAPAAPPVLPTLTPMPKVIDASNPKAAMKRQQALASLLHAMNAEAQRDLHELRTKLENEGVYIDTTANAASFANAARLLLANESIVMQARFLESQVEVVDGE